MLRQPFTKSVTESVCYSPNSKVDREQAVIRDVMILGKLAKNGREYSQQARLAAVPLYEGMSVNLNHPSREAIKTPRGIEEKWGWLQNVRATDDGVMGDLHYLKSHQYTEQLLELAERNPAQFGLSHNADCSGYRTEGKSIIESVDKVRSVDVVQRPATTSGLFEHEEEEPMKTTIKAILTGVPDGTRGKKQLLAVLEMDGMADMGAVAVDAPAEGAAPEDQVWEAFRTAVISILDNNDLSMEDTITQMSEVLKKYEESFGSANPTTEDKTVPTTEGIDELRREVKQMKAENKALTLLVQNDIEATPGRVKSVISVLESETELKDVLSSFPKRTAKVQESTPDAGRSKKPIRSVPATEQDTNGGAQRSGLLYKGYKELAASIR